MWSPWRGVLISLRHLPESRDPSFTGGVDLAATALAALGLAGLTYVVYAALGGTPFLLPITLQQVAGYSPLASGAALLPITLITAMLIAAAACLVGGLLAAATIRTRSLRTRHAGCPASSTARWTDRHCTATASWPPRPGRVARHDATP
jgi:hypothetical protein